MKMKVNHSETGASARTKRRHPLQFYLLIAFIFFISPLSISFGDSEARITVKNKTDHFLHIYIDGAPYLYVAPKRSITKEAATTTFDVTAFYAPGQGVSGTIDRYFPVPDYNPASSTSGCRDEGPNSGCECSQTTTPAEYGSVTWEITADTMTVVE